MIDAFRLELEDPSGRRLRELDNVFIFHFKN